MLENEELLRPEADGAPVIWAVGGGKGGVGKTVITANLAITLAKLGKRCVAIDADLGGANLHTVLGIPNPKRTLSDFLTRAVNRLDEVTAPTTHPNLRFVSGSKALLDMANPRFTQKERIIRHLLELDADIVLLDLGAGTAFNTLDFFIIADRGILVVLPEPTSVENAYHFIKAAFYRRLKRATAQDGVAEAVDRAMSEKAARGIQSPRALIRTVEEIAPEAGEALHREAEQFRPSLIVNQVRRWDERDLGKDICTACRDYFGIEIDYLGTVDDDPHVRDAIRLRHAVLDSYPAGSFARSISAIARRLIMPGESAP